MHRMLLYNLMSKAKRKEKKTSAVKNANKEALDFSGLSLLTLVFELVKTSSLVILSVRRTYCFWRFKTAKCNWKLADQLEINCKIKMIIIKRLSAILPTCSTLQTGSDTVFKSLRFRPSTRQRSVFESLRLRKFPLSNPLSKVSKTLNKRLRVDGRWKRTEKSPFSHENVYVWMGP